MYLSKLQLEGECRRLRWDGGGGKNVRMGESTALIFLMLILQLHCTSSVITNINVKVHKQS